MRERVIYGQLFVVSLTSLRICSKLNLSSFSAHPNVKLFISHGGLFGTTEAVYEGVPVLGIPIFADQPGNIETIKANGAGERLDYPEISEEVVYEKVSRLLNDPK